MRSHEERIAEAKRRIAKMERRNGCGAIRLPRLPLWRRALR